MSQIDHSAPVNDLDQLVVDPVADQQKYLGNASVVHTFVGNFADDVTHAYSGFLGGESTAGAAQARVDALVQQYGDDFMGRGRYQIAPWQGVRLRQKMLREIPGHHVDDDCGQAFFKHLALLCIKCAIGLSKGFPDEDVGEQLKKILDWHRGFILGLDV